MKTGHFWEILLTVRDWTMLNQSLTDSVMQTVGDWLIPTQFPTVNDTLTVGDRPIPNGLQKNIKKDGKFLNTNFNSKFSLTI